MSAVASALGALCPSRTKVRRLQRKHSKVCYKLLQQRLLDIVVPVPCGAILAVDLEQFRSQLYGAPAEPSLPPLQKDLAIAEQTSNTIKDSDDLCQGIICNLCGVWCPLPLQSSASPICGPTPSAGLPASDGAQGNLPALAATPCVDPLVPVAATATAGVGFDLLQPTLCEAVCAAYDDMVEKVEYRRRVENIKAKWRSEAQRWQPVSQLPVVGVQQHMKRYSFKRSSRESDVLGSYVFSNTEQGNQPGTLHASSRASTACSMCSGTGCGFCSQQCPQQ